MINNRLTSCKFVSRFFVVQREIAVIVTVWSATGGAGMVLTGMRTRRGQRRDRTAAILSGLLRSHVLRDVELATDSPRSVCHLHYI